LFLDLVDWFSPASLNALLFGGCFLLLRCSGWTPKRKRSVKGSMKAILSTFSAAAAVASALLINQQSISAADVTGDRANIGTGHTLAGTLSSITGGRNNTITNTHSFIGGGTNNYIGGYEAVIGGGRDNIIQQAKHTVIAGGHNNAIFSSIGEHAVISGGEQNTNNSMWATIGGGFVNLIQTNATNGTISGGFSNKLSAVGGVIGGGYFNVMDAQHATLAGGYTNESHGPYGFMGGGYGNNDNGVYSVIAGGYYNHVGTNPSPNFNGAANTIGGGAVNTNNGSYSTIAGGFENTIGHELGTIAGGRGNTVRAYGGFIGGGEANSMESNDVATGHSVIGGGFGNQIKAMVAAINGGWFGIIDTNGLTGFIGAGTENYVNGYSGSIAGGEYNSVTASLGSIPGGGYAKASHYAQMAYASGAFAAAGDAQTSVYVLRQATSNGTQTELFLDGASARMTIPSGTTWTFSVHVTGRSSAGSSAGYKIEGVIQNNSGTTSIVGTAPTTVLAEAVAAWDAVVQADNTNDALVLKVTGAASTNIRWVATVRTTEVSY
jgi:hypothetical protein